MRQALIEVFRVPGIALIIIVNFAIGDVNKQYVMQTKYLSLYIYVQSGPKK